MSKGYKKNSTQVLSQTVVGYVESYVVLVGKVCDLDESEYDNKRVDQSWPNGPTLRHYTYLSPSV